MSRYVSGILALALLTGCATAKPQTTIATPEQRDACVTEASAYKLNPLAKGLIYASNIIVVPMTFGQVWVYPKPDNFGRVYESCMDRVTKG